MRRQVIVSLNLPYIPESPLLAAVIRLGLCYLQAVLQLLHLKQGNPIPESNLSSTISSAPQVKD